MGSPSITITCRTSDVSCAAGCLQSQCTYTWELFSGSDLFPSSISPYFPAFSSSLLQGWSRCTLRVSRTDTVCPPHGCWDRKLWKSFGGMVPSSIEARNSIGSVVQDSYCHRGLKEVWKTLLMVAVLQTL